MCRPMYFTVHIYFIFKSIVTYHETNASINILNVYVGRIAICHRLQTAQQKRTRVVQWKKICNKKCVRV
jgi:hypothetical protein